MTEQGEGTRRKTPPPKNLRGRITPEENILGSVFNEWPTTKELRARPEIPNQKLDIDALLDNLTNRQYIGKENYSPEDEQHLPQKVRNLDSSSKNHEALKQQILEVMGSLTGRERHVLDLRLGLKDGRPHTLKEVGREIGRSASTARRISIRAMQKLNQPSSITLSNFTK